MVNLYLEALQRRIVAEFASRRNEVEHVQLLTHEGRAVVITGSQRPRDITPMGARS